MAAALLRASKALGRGDGRAAVLAFTEAAASRETRIAAQASHDLGAMYRGAGGDARVPLDVRASARAYARCVLLLAGDPAVARQRYLAIFVDAVHACCVALTKELPPDSPEVGQVLAALKATCRACGGDAPQISSADAAVFAWSHRSLTAFVHGDLEEAARCLRHTIAEGLQLRPGCDPRARGYADSARRNLAALEARSDEERLRASQDLNASTAYPSRVFTAVTADGTPRPPVTVPRERCAACGASPLVLKKCGGSCGGAVCYCDAVCHAAHVREHMRESGCKKR
jgi:hypothetical protein